MANNSNWSAENAAKAFIKTMKMVSPNVKEPDVSEFVSALAAGNNAKLMVAAGCCVGTDGISTVLALVAAANLTKGKVVCILRSPEELHRYRVKLGQTADQVEFSVGEAESLLVRNYRESDFVVVDCNIYDQEKISMLVQGGIVLGYNALSMIRSRGSGGGDQSKDDQVQLLPIGEGLLLSRISGKHGRRPAGGRRNKNGTGNNWVVKVDKCTGEEHVFRVRSHDGRTVAC